MAININATKNGQRLSLRELDRPENSQKKNDFLKAFKIIKELPPEDNDSYWAIASYHGMPYRRRQVEPITIRPNAENNSAWNGYCQHGNILFPTWHRWYCLKLEQALQRAVPDGDVMLHYWDQTSEENLKSGMPPLLTQKTVTIDGVPGIENPLLSFKLPKEIPMSPAEHNADNRAQYYVKPRGYVTKRYPFSGIVNPPSAKEAANRHNDQVGGYQKAPEVYLAENIRYWLNEEASKGNNILCEYRGCLDVCSYNQFSNTTSAAGSNYNLEQPHNDIHLAIGGFTMPFPQGDGSATDEEGNVDHFGLMEGANGDMGENETAAFDPIFFVHHSNIDRIFWIWQKKWGYTTSIPLDENKNDSGLTPVGQGPTPHQKIGERLNFQTFLAPFKDEATGQKLTSEQCVDIRKLGYDYSVGSLDQYFWPNYPIRVPKRVDACLSRMEPILIRPENDALVPIAISFDRANSNMFLVVRNINKNGVAGSFVVQAFYRKDAKLYFIGQKGVLSRWNRQACGNCMTRPTTSVCFLIDDIVPQCENVCNIEVVIYGKDPETGRAKRTKITHMMPSLDKFGFETNDSPLEQSMGATARYHSSPESVRFHNSRGPTGQNSRRFDRNSENSGNCNCQIL